MLVSSASTLPSIMEEACATFNCMLAVFWNPASRGMVAKSFEIDLEQVKKEFVNYDSLNSNFIGTQWHATRGKHAECCHNISLMELLAGHLTPSPPLAPRAETLHAKRPLCKPWMRSSSHEIAALPEVSAPLLRARRTRQTRHVARRP